MRRSRVRMLNSQDRNNQLIESPFVDILSQYNGHFSFDKEYEKKWVLIDKEGEKWILIQSEFNPARLELLADAIDFINKKGFKNTITILRNRKGNVTTTVDEKNFYYIIQLFNENKIENTDVTEVNKLCSIISRFHQASLGFKPTASLNEFLYQKNWLITYQQRISELLLYKNIAINSPRSDFDGVFVENVDYFYTQAQEAILEMTVNGFSELYKQFSDIGCLGQNAFRSSHFQRKQDTYVIVHPYNWVWQIPVIDFGVMLTQYLPRYNWDKTIAKKFVETYLENRTMSNQELEILWAYLKFPKRFWQYANYYYKGNRTQNWDLVSRLITYRKETSNRNECIESLSKEFTGGK